MANRCLNKVILIGNLTRDPELRYTPDGTAVCTFGLATNRSWVTNEGEKKEEVQYHRIVAWHKLAELCAKILTKGSKVYVEGRIAYRSFTGKDGQEVNVAEIIMDDFISMDNKGKKEKKEVEVAQAAPEEKVEEKEEKKEDEKNEAPEGEKKEEVNLDDIPF